jgi:hypothetical protein
VVEGVGFYDLVYVVFRFESGDREVILLRHSTATIDRTGGDAVTARKNKPRWSL